ncbi:hypothetical protein THAOC_10671 [Thalassiosira oceanica]|uniref:Uncharacterized protein n=1 Tax=Thalassiosira oceanica TaxID=159749 RepID=K0ST93_THAOC|nr:hypothetical protein THAOC_10671 [Thalassiosira oceanica]|eukprot:EJK68174.1 hypothetical protein THAOC_10671 [Thalassiosira oceanica]
MMPSSLSSPRPRRSQGEGSAVSGSTPGRSPLSAIGNSAFTPPRSDGKENRLQLGTPASVRPSVADDADADGGSGGDEDDSLAPDQLRREVQCEYANLTVCDLVGGFEEIEKHNERASRANQSAEDDISVMSDTSVDTKDDAHKLPVFHVLESCRAAAGKIDAAVDGAARNWMRMSDRRRAEIAQRPTSVRVDDVARAARRKRKRGSGSSGDRADGDESGDEDEDGEENDLQLDCIGRQYTGRRILDERHLLSNE